MQKKEEKLCSFTQKGTRLQLVKVMYLNEQQQEKGSIYKDKIKYQLRQNRKIVKTSIREFPVRKLFAIYVQNIVLQLKIY